MDRVEHIYTDPVQRNQTAAWRGLLQDDRLNDPEIREILLYRTFYFFVEKLSAQTADPATVVAGEVVRLFADRFEWINEEASLIRQFGTSRINLVFSHAYGQPEPDKKTSTHTGHSAFKYYYPVTSILIVVSILVLIVVYGLKNNTQPVINPNLPYYNCKILFFKTAKQKNYSNCHNRAENEDDKAQLLFGLAQLYSRNFAKKPAAAISWLTRSANQSNGRAMFMLGVLQGDDIKVGGKVVKHADFARARDWLEQAAKAGEKYADTYLASLYVIRNSGSDDYRLARARLVIAANAEQPDSYMAMALFDLYGLVTKVDYGVARKWLDLYARSDIPEGSNDAAWMLATSPDSNFRDGRQASEYVGFLLKDRKDPNLYMYLDTVAAVKASVGKFNEAVDFEEQAINLLKDQDKKVYRENIDGFQKRLNSYKNKKPWTEKLPGNYLQQSFIGIRNRIFSRELADIILKTS